MWYLIIISVVVLGVLVGAGCKISTNKKQGTDLINNLNDSGMIYSKSDIEKKLKELAKSKPKNLETIGAMCYEMAMPPERAEYVCTVCGEKTIYTIENAEFISWYLPSCRDMVTKLKSVNAVLDESQYCKDCSPDIETPVLCLITKLEGSSEIKTCGINNDDLKILGEFLDGSKIHSGSFDEQYPLKGFIPRIEEMLGINIDEKKYE